MEHGPDDDVDEQQHAGPRLVQGGLQCPPGVVRQATPARAQIAEFLRGCLVDGRPGRDPANRLTSPAE